MVAEEALPPSVSPLTPIDFVQISSLYVGDLESNVTEADLTEAFRFFGPLSSVRVCRDFLTGKSLRYGYVNFFSRSHASKAMSCLKHSELKGKPMRIMWSQRDPLTRRTGVANLFVKNLDRSITSGYLEGLFSTYGTILSCKVAEENGKSKGFGFVQFDSEKSAMAAIRALHESSVKGKTIYVAKFVKKSQRSESHEELTFTNLYVKNLDENMTEDILRDKFSEFGKVTCAAIMKDDKGNSRGFGFVKFESPEEAKKAVEGLNGSLLGSKHLFVGRAQKKEEREKLLNWKSTKMFYSHIEKLKASNLFVKNLDTSVDERKLREYFSCCGKVISVKVMRFNNGFSKGSGFVCLSTPEEAIKALDLNGTILEGKPLRVTLAERKNDFWGALQNQYTQLFPSNLHTANLGASSSIPIVQHNFTSSSNQQTCSPYMYEYVGGKFVPLMMQNYQFQYPKNVPVKYINPTLRHNFMNGNLFATTGSGTYGNPEKLIGGGWIRTYWNGPGESSAATSLHGNSNTTNRDGFLKASHHSEVSKLRRS